MSVGEPRLRVLLGAILFRAALRAAATGGRALAPEDKALLHRFAEEAAWSVSARAAALVAGRDVDDGLPEDEELAQALRQVLADALGARGP